MSSSNLDQMCCSACGRISIEPEEIITCGDCGAVYHSSCVEIPAADEKWYCPEGCWYDHYQPKDVPGSSARTSCVKPDAATGSETPEVAESALDQEATEFDAERWLREKQKEIEMELAERQAQIDRELRVKEAQMAEAFQEKLRRQEANLELELKKKEEHVVRLHELETSYRRRSSLLDEQLELSKFDFGKFMRVVGLTADEAGSPMADEDDVGVSESSEGSDGSAESRTVSADEEDGVMLKKQERVEGNPDGLGQRCSGCGEKELARRRRRKRTSKKSSEEPVEMPQSTGIDQVSVIARGMSERRFAKHQDRLEGAVRENVLGKFHPFSPQIDITGPESVRELERLESDKFARRTMSAVNRLCDDVGVADGTFHLVNPLSFLVGELPDGEKRIWRICMKTETEKSMYLSSVIVDTGTVNGEFSPIMISGPGAKRDTAGPELRWLVQMDSSKSGETIKKYDKAYNQLQVCNDVEKLPVDERMRIVSRWKRRSGEVCELVGGKFSAFAILPVEPRSVQERLVMQRTAVAAHAWTSEWAAIVFCAGQRMPELEEALTAKYGNDVAADNGRTEEIVELKRRQPETADPASSDRMESVGKSTSGMGNARFSGSTVCVTMSRSQLRKCRRTNRDPWAPAQIDVFPEKQNLRESQSGLVEEANDPKKVGCDDGDSGGTSLQNPSVDEVVRKDVNQRLEGTDGIDTGKQSNGKKSEAPDGAQERTNGNVGRTTNPKAAIGKPDTVDSNSIQRDVHEQSQERKSWLEDGRHGEI